MNWPLSILNLMLRSYFSRSKDNLLHVCWNWHRNQKWLCIPSQIVLEFSSCKQDLSMEFFCCKAIFVVFKLRSPNDMEIYSYYDANIQVYLVQTDTDVRAENCLTSGCFICLPDGSSVLWKSDCESLPPPREVELLHFFLWDNSESLSSPWVEEDTTLLFFIW